MTEQKAMTMSRDEMQEVGVADAFEEADFAILYREVEDCGTTSMQEIFNVPTAYCREIAAALRAQAGSKPLRQDGGCSCARAGFPESCDNCDGAHARRIRRLALRGVSDKLDEIAPAVEALARHQEQCDEDGVMVQVSRQAVDEVVNTINQIAIDLAAQPANSGQARSLSADEEGLVQKALIDSAEYQYPPAQRQEGAEPVACLQRMVMLWQNQPKAPLDPWQDGYSAGLRVAAMHAKQALASPQSQSEASSASSPPMQEGLRQIVHPIQGWEVEVRLNGETALTIGHNHLAGIESIEEFDGEVETCARHLLAFIGRTAESPRKEGDRDGADEA